MRQLAQADTCQQNLWFIDWLIIMMILFWVTYNTYMQLKSKTELHSVKCRAVTFWYRLSPFSVTCKSLCHRCIIIISWCFFCTCLPLLSLSEAVNQWCGDCVTLNPTLHIQNCCSVLNAHARILATKWLCKRLSSPSTWHSFVISISWCLTVILGAL